MAVAITIDQAARGREAARRLWNDGLQATIDDPLDPEFAAAAVAEFAHLQRERTPGIYRDALAGAEMSAEQLNVEPFHGVVEVVQNADDAHARELRLAVRSRSGGRDLLFVHDGDPVRLPELVAMALAFVSTKREEVASKGRFGIGLKTLSRLGDTLAVHCGPYHAAIAGNHIAPVAPASAIGGFYRPQAGETLLELRLRSGFDAGEFTAWLSEWDASSLLFLDSVRVLRLVSLRARKPLIELRLDEHDAGRYALDVGRQSLHCAETILKDPSTGRTWRRYSVERQVPRSAPKRRHKATGKTTPLAVAVPDRVGEPGRLFAGLPLRTSLGAPFSLNGQFNVDTPRTAAQHDAWNGWLLDRLMEFVGAVTSARFAKPAAGWISVPLATEVTSIPEEWLRERLLVGTRAIQRRLARVLTVDVEGRNRRLDQLIYAAQPLERLLDAQDLERLYPRFSALPRAARDRDGRWRAVLSELGEATEVAVVDALRLLDGDAVDQRPVSWFIRFARAVIGADEGDKLWWKRALILADGTRIVPPAPHVEAEVLVRRARPESLAARLGMARVINSAYLSANPEAAAVRRWLEGGEILVDDIGDESALRALAQRGTTDTEPVALGDRELIALRDAFARLDRHEQNELGPDLGRALTVRGFRWERGKRVRTAVVPAAAYLPATLEDRTEGWAKAAASTASIAWIETRYGNVLRRPKGDRRTPAALAFFRLLGAEVAPRLVEPRNFDTRYGDPASPIDFDALTPIQREALAGVQATHLQREQLSPDLASVAHDISRERSRRRRRERARALIATFDREWQRLYDGHETAVAVYSSHTWSRVTTLPASWLATAMDTPWLTTEAGVATPPRELVVRTKATEALHGRDAAVYCAEVGSELATSPTVRAIGLTTDPRVSEVVEQLAAIRADTAPVDATEVAVRYAALAAAVANVDAALDTRIGDLTVRQLRARFGADRRKPGLILVDGRWRKPAQVLRGKPIFGHRRAFVPERSHADRLWRVLGIRTPTLSDCIEVLKQIARAAPDEADEQILLDTYVYMNENLGEATRGELRALGELALWSGKRWLTKRPIYTVEDAMATSALAQKLPIWQPPLAARSLSRLAGALGVTALDDRSFTPRIGDAERLAGEGLQDTFAAAVAHLREWLARHDPQLYDAIARWSDLAGAAIALAPNLELELRLPGRRPLRVPAHAHASRQPLQLAFAELDDVGAEDAGGRAVAGLFAEGDRDKVALAWASSWSSALKGDRTARLRLAEEQDEGDALDALFEQAATAARTQRKPLATMSKAKGRSVTTPRQSQPTVAARRLKSADQLVAVASVTRPDGGDGTRAARGSRGLRADKPSGRPIDAAATPAPRSAPRAYSPQEQEHLALVALQRAINDELSDLRDFRHLQGIGADALDGLERAFEIKSFATAMPDQVTLTANEFQRALRDGAKYYLAVVAGLEQGYETVVRIIADPVHTLAVQKSTTVVLGGVLNTTKPIEVRFSSEPKLRDDSVATS